MTASVGWNIRGQISLEVFDRSGVGSKGRERGEMRVEFWGGADWGERQRQSLAHLLSPHTYIHLNQ